MRKPTLYRGAGFSNSAEINANIRRGTIVSHALQPARRNATGTPTLGDLSARLYGPITRDRYGATIEDEPIPASEPTHYPTTGPAERPGRHPFGMPALSPAEIRRRRSERKIQTELRRRSER